MSGGQVSCSHPLDPHLVTVTGRAAQIRCPSARPASGTERSRRYGQPGVSRSNSTTRPPAVHDARPERPIRAPRRPGIRTVLISDGATPAAAARAAAGEGKRIMSARRDELTEPAMDAAIERACTILRLPTVRDRTARSPGSRCTSRPATRGSSPNCCRWSAMTGRPAAAPGSSARPPSPGRKDRGLRLRREPQRACRAGRDAGPLPVGRRRAAAVPGRRLRHGEVAPADRAGHRGGRAGLPGPLRHRPRPWSTSSPRPPTTACSPR